MAKTNLATTPEPFVFYKHVGSTTYRVGLHFSPDAKETLDEKIMRLIKNDLQNASESSRINSLQAGWLSERSSS